MKLSSSAAVLLGAAVAAFPGASAAQIVVSQLCSRSGCIRPSTSAVEADIMNVMNMRCLFRYTSTPGVYILVYASSLLSLTSIYLTRTDDSLSLLVLLISLSLYSILICTDACFAPPLHHRIYATVSQRIPSRNLD
jgi:hypothetical protein